MKDFMEFYSVTSYLSGTTWLNSEELDCHFHVGYWDGISRDVSELTLPDRNTMERIRFIYALRDMLNKINITDYKPYISSIFAGKMEIKDSRVVFTDACFGELEIINYVITINSTWEETSIPKKVVQDLENGFQRMLECSKDDIK